ncbi:hypothetical protein ABZ543_08445 [Streptomyces roseifaciens]
MGDPTRDPRPVGELAQAREELSEQPERFRSCLSAAFGDLAAGEDLATAAWTADDPVRLAAEIEALAGRRRLENLRKDQK